MTEYDIINNYFMYEELDSDAVGVNYRVGEIKGRKAEKHYLLAQAYPSLSNDPNIWKRIIVLMEGIKKPNIPGLYCPEKVVSEGNKVFLIYPFLKGRPLDSIIEDARKSDNPIDSELTFAIALGIADALDAGSSIIINKQKSFHGILTPDNIVIDFDGKIALKNYGIFPYLKDAPQLLTKTKERFGEMLSPEFTRDGELSPKGDIYHLGNLVHRMLTGKYFRHSDAEDFESQLAKIELMDFIVFSDDDSSSSIIDLFRRTLNPDSSKRFASIKEFKDFISKHFHVDEVSSATFVIAYFINQLYMKTIEQEDKRLQEELTYALPDEKEEIKETKPFDRSQIEDHVIEDILIELEQQKRSRRRLVLPFILIIIAIVAISGYIIINQQKKAERDRALQEQRAQELEDSIAKMRADLRSQYEKQLNQIETKAATTEEEKSAREKEIEDLKKWRLEQEQLAIQQYEVQQRALEEARKQKLKEQPKEEPKAETPPPAETAAPVKTPDTTPVVKTEEPPAEVTAKDIEITKPGDIISLDSVTFTPSKLSGKRNFKADGLKLSDNTLRQYAGKTLIVEADILINETGYITDVNPKGVIPGDLKAEVRTALRTWTYVPAEKDKTKVKVWLPVDLKITFGGEPPKEPTPTPTKKAPAKTPKFRIDESTIAPLGSLTFKPSKMSGKRRLKAEDLQLPRAITNEYKGQNLDITAEILVSEHGNILKVKVMGDLPEAIKLRAAETLITWKYIPGEKNKEKVKVWLPVELRITFPGQPEKKKEEPKEAPKEAPKKEVKEKPKEEPKKAPEEIKIDESTIVPLDAITQRPSKMRGNRRVNAGDLNLPRAVRSKYKGQTITLGADVLVGEHGNILKVRVKGDFPQELKVEAAQTLKTWKFIPAEKNKEKVKVWFPVRLTISFK